MNINKVRSWGPLSKINATKGIANIISISKREAIIWRGNKELIRISNLPESISSLGLGQLKLNTRKLGINKFIINGNFLRI